MRLQRTLLLPIVAFAVGLSAAPTLCLAQAPGEFDESIAASSAILIGRLDQYIPEPESLDRMVEQQLQASNFMTGNAEAVVLETIQPRGTYVFTVISTLKGQPPQPLVVRLPRISGNVIEDMLNGNKPRRPLKANYLLLLAGNDKTGFAPQIAAPIALGPKVQGPKAPIDDAKPEALVTGVAALLIDTLSDPATRPGAARTLSQMQTPLALPALRPFADDPNDQVRAAALQCQGNCM